MSLISELKRRNVFRVALLYLVAGWVILQVSQLLFDVLKLPDWTSRLVLGLLMLGFPLALIFSWVYELTPDGLKRDAHVPPEHSIGSETGRRIGLKRMVDELKRSLLLELDYRLEAQNMIAIGKNLTIVGVKTQATGIPTLTGNDETRVLWIKASMWSR